MAPMGRGKVYREPVQRYSQYSIWLSFNQRYKQQLPSQRRIALTLTSRRPRQAALKLLVIAKENPKPLLVA
jgi:hypothetical protein